MNIKQAKQEIINTVKAYLKRDETGAYEIQAHMRFRSSGRGPF